MTTLEQALHIFRKDARHLRWEIAGVLLLLLVLILSGAETWEAVQEQGRSNSGGEDPISFLLPVAWSLLIARAIQTEALPGDRHFWLTRPYSRAGLMLSKALFIVAFVNLPFMLAQAAIVYVDGLPLLSNLAGLLWNQVLISIILLLPVAAIAALTRNLAQFLPAVVLTAGLLAGPVGDRSFFYLEWVRSSLGLSIGVAIAALVVWRQYRLRRSGNTALLAIGATIAGIILYLSFPRSAAFAVQSRLMGSHDGKFALSLAKAAPRKPETAAVNRYRQLLVLPLDVVGATPQDVQLGPIDVTFKTLSGITRRAPANVEVVGDKLMFKTFVDRRFFEAAKDSPVSLRAEFYLTLIGNPRSAEAPLDGTPIYISGPGQCGAVAGYDERRFVCRSAFRGPQWFLSDRLQPRFPDSGAGYSPFPAHLRIYPVAAVTYQLQGADELAPAAPERPATLLVRDPVAFFRYTMEAADLRLGDFAVTEPDQDAGQ